MSRKNINFRIGWDLKAFSDSSQNLQRQLQSTSKKMMSIGKSMSLSLTAPITLLGGAAFKTFATFEQSMAKVQAISGSTGKDFENLTNLAKDLGIATRFSASEVSELMLNYSKLGFSSSEIQKITGATLNLALATGEDLAQSAEVAGATLRGFGLDAAQMGAVTDVMARSFSSSALDLNKFQVAMSTVAPVSKSAGVTLQETTAMLGVLANNGVEASTSGTGLRNIFLDLASKGMSFEQAMSQINGSTNKNATAMELFGKRGATVATILAENQVQIDGLEGKLNDTSVTAAGMAEIMDNTSEGAMMRLKSATEGLGIEFGEIMAPAIGKIADILSLLAIGFANTNKYVKTAITVVGGLLALLGPIALAVAGVNAALAFLAANPIVLTIVGIIVALGVLAATFMYVRDNLEAFGDYFYNIWVDIVNTTVDAVANIVKSIDEFASMFNVDLGATKFFNGLKMTARKSKKDLKPFSDTVENIKKEFGELIDLETESALNIVPENADEAKDTINQIVDSAEYQLKLAKAQGATQDELIKKERQLLKLKIKTAESERDKLVATRELNLFEEELLTKERKLKITADWSGLGKILEDMKPKIEEKLNPTAKIDIKPLTNEELGIVFEPTIFEKMGAEAGEALTSGLKSLATEGLVSFGQFMGDVMSGGDTTMEDFGRGLLNSIGGFMGQFGEAMIAIGIAEAMVQASIKSMNPALAIAGGIPLVAAGAAISNLSKKGIQTEGGGSASPSMGGVGGMGSPQMNPIALETKVSGRDLILVQNREKGFSR